MNGLCKTIGRLESLRAMEHFELLASPVAHALKNLSTPEKVHVAKIDPELSDTAAFCASYNIEPGQAANCVILEAKRGDKKWFAACVILGNTRADINGLARRTLDARKISFAPMDQTVTKTGMEYGAITPIGLPENWPILIDQAVADSSAVVIGSGKRFSKIITPGSILGNLPHAQVLEGLGKEK